jgi:hypothetical protein
VEDTSLRGLLNQPGFQRMSEARERDALDGILDSSDPAAETGRIGREVMARSDTAALRANAIAKMLRHDGLSDAEVALLPAGVREKWGGDLDDNDLTRSLNPAPPRFYDIAGQDAIAALLQGEDASDVLDAFHANHSGLTDNLYDLLRSDLRGVTDDPTARERQNVNDILDRLDPQAAAKFVQGISNSVGRELDSTNLLGAVLGGFSYAQEEGINWNAGGLSDWVQEKLTEDEGALLVNMFQHLAEKRRIDGDGRWSEAEEQEFLSKLGILEDARARARRVTNPQ